MRTTIIIWRCADREPDDDTALGVNYHRPAAADRNTRHHRDAETATISIINGGKDCVANAPIAKLFAVEAQTDDGPALILVPRDTAGLTITEQPEPRWYHGACGQIALKDCRVPAGQPADARRPPDAGRGAAAVRRR